MTDHIKRKIDDLKDSLERGKSQRQDLEQKMRELDATLMRISGAIQVLEELLAEQEGQGSGSVA